MRMSTSPATSPRVRFDRNELSGAFGDLGTDFPLLVGLTLAANLEPAGVLLMFGAMQILTGLAYGIPMPAQPLKAMAVLVITGQVPGPVLFGGGLAIGLVMLGLAGSGLLEHLARTVPKPVVRGIQLGLGLQLGLLALRDYVPAEGAGGYALGALAFAIVVALLGNRRFPPALFVVGLGVLYALLWRVDVATLAGSVGLAWPRWRVPSPSDLWNGLLVLAIPQLPLSLSNSILATRQVAEDLFPERAPSVRRIGLTYALMNLVNPFFGGVPTCHGSGGMAGHYAFGARTGGSVVLYGSMYVLLGLFFARGFDQVAHLFPKPVLGVILLFEAVALMALVRDTASDRTAFTIVLLTGLMAAALPYGYVVALAVGAALAHAAERRGAPSTGPADDLRVGRSGKLVTTSAARESS
jgi:MFS superfamily sulfate permease-like transporter